MPSMPRPDDKPKKIAFDILGTPPNMRKRKGKESKQSERLAQEELQRPKTASI